MTQVPRILILSLIAFSAARPEALSASSFETHSTPCGANSNNGIAVSVAGGSGPVSGAGATPRAARRQAAANLLPLVLHCADDCDPGEGCFETAVWTNGEPTVGEAAWNPQLGLYTAQASVPPGGSIEGYISCSACASEPLIGL